MSLSTKCKRCNAANVYWERSITGKWTLFCEQTNQKHFCEDGKLKAVKCKYCSADDLHWAEDVDPITKQKKAVLTESYGLPHACDERIFFLAKEKQDKKDKYDAEKKRVAAELNGVCSKCRGSGYGQHNSSVAPFGFCESCYGHRCFSDSTRKAILATARKSIWPHMNDHDKRQW
jgi:hypothetical protein